MRQIFGDIRWELKAAVFLGLIISFSLVGPFGSYDSMTLAERFTYWTVIMIGVAFFMHVFITVVLTSRHLAKWPDVLKVAVGATAAALPGAAVVEFVNEIFRPTGINMVSLTRTWIQISIIGMLVGLVEYIDWRAPADRPNAPVLTTFHKRLSPELGHDILSLSMQDHYVNVTTTQGSELVLMRLSDALNELGALAGQRIHRSHWIALAHVKKVVKDGARHVAILDDDRRLPVSATYIEALQTALAGRAGT